MNIVQSVTFTILIPSICFKSALNNFSDNNEMQLTFDLTAELNIRQVILVGEKNNVNQKTISQVKNFFSVRMSVAYFNLSQLALYVIGNNENINFKTVIILREKDLPVMIELSQQFEEEDAVNKTMFWEPPNQSHKLRRFTWLIITSTFQLIRDLNLVIPYNCEFITIESENGINYKLKEIYKVKNKTFTSDFGTWDRDFGLNIPIGNFYIRRQDLNGTELTTADDYTDGCYGDWRPIFYCSVREIIPGLSNKMNFKSKISEGYTDIGKVIFASTLINVPGKTQTMLGPIFKTQIDWYIKNPSAEFRSDYYLQPFQFLVWIVMIFLVISAAILTIMIQNLTINKEGKRTLVDAAFLSFETFCNQCGNENIEKVPLRTVSIILRLTVLFIIACYGAVITSYMSVQIPEIPFKNKKEFLQNGAYQFSSGGHISFLRLLVNIIEDSDMTKIIDNFTVNDTYRKFEDHAEKICSEKIAVLNINLYDNEVEFPCDIYKIPEPIMEAQGILLLESNSPFQEAFHITFTRFYFESGISKMMQSASGQLYFKKKPEEQFESVEIGQMKQVLSIPFLGVLLGIVIAFSECIYRRSTRS